MTLLLVCRQIVGGRLTFLSIITTLLDMEKSGDLVRYQPTVSARGRGAGYRRTLLLTPDAYAWCRPAGPHPDARIGDESLIDLQFVLNSYVLNEELLNGMDAKRLDPPDKEVWEFRSYVKQPRLRLFGSFAHPRFFVGTHYRVRSDLEPKRGPQWNKVIRETYLEIRRFFGGYLPFSGRTFRSYFQ